MSQPDPKTRIRPFEVWSVPTAEGITSFGWTEHKVSDHLDCDDACEMIYTLNSEDAPDARDFRQLEVRKVADA